MQVHASLGIMPQCVDKAQQVYTAADLRLGSCVDVHGRRFWLHDCDAFTRAHYQVGARLGCGPLANAASTSAAAGQSAVGDFHLTHSNQRSGKVGS